MVGSRLLATVGLAQSPVPVDGMVHPDFVEVADALRWQLAAYPGGAAVCVYHRGECVADLWGGGVVMAESDLTVTEICFEVGFESLGSFSTLFHTLVGWSPSIYRVRSWEMRKNPLKFIPNCYVIMHGIQVSDPNE